MPLSIKTLLFLLLLSSSNAFSQENVNPTDLWMGTGGWPQSSGMTFPGATTPFGLVRLSPDTKPAFPFSLPLFNKIGYSTGGYGYRDPKIFGFSHTRLEGTGGRDGGVFRVLPVRKLPRNFKSAPSARYRHRNEDAHAGYYEITLPPENVDVELTASPHCGFHRYTKLSSRRPLHLLLDVTSGLIQHPGSLDGQLEINADQQSISGQVRTRGDFSLIQNGLFAYFYAEYSTPMQSTQIWKDHYWLDQSTTQASGDNLGVALSTTPDTDEVELKLCVSHVSVQNAKLNFEAEARGVDFDQAQTRTESLWQNYFDRARITTSDADFERLYYTNLYFSSVMPTNFTDTNGEYLGFDNKIGVAKDYTYRTDLSLWDTFRTANPLYNLIAPEVSCDVVQSLMQMAKVSGVFPRLAYGTESLSMMFGSPANFVLAEAYVKGICKFDTHTALVYMWKGATDDEFTREHTCVTHGYCPSDETTQSVSKTVEDAWADFAAAELAHATGETEMEANFRTKEVAFRNVWDPSTRYFRPKNAAGEFTAFNPKMTSYFEFIYKPAINYAEGGPNHYRYTAPHHIQELISLFGGPEPFVDELEKFMEGATRHRGAFNPGPNYWHGDEHDLHAIYLFSEAGRPDLTQYWARWALRDRYALAPNGLDGNDDAGSITAWFVMSSLGLYSQSGTDRYWLGSPAVDTADVKLGPNHVLHIVANHQSSDNVYVKSVSLNGKRLCSPTIHHADLIDAQLTFEMSADPEATFDCKIN